MDNSDSTNTMNLSTGTDVMPDTADASPFFASSNETTDSNPNQPDNSQAVTSSQGSTGGRKRQVFMLVIALILMVVGIASGTMLLNRNQSFEPSFGWDCALYKFNVDETGSVTVQNGSSRDLPAQVATVYIDNVQVAEFDVQALDAGAAQSLGVVPVPEDGKFGWRVVGNKECDQNGGSAPTAKAECINIKAFDEEWNPLTVADLSSFKTGDKVRFSVAGETNQGTLQGARFTINGTLRDEVTDLRPGTNEYYDEYTIPANTKGFSVSVELLHSEASWF